MILDQLAMLIVRLLRAAREDELVVGDYRAEGPLFRRFEVVAGVRRYVITIEEVTR